LQAVARCHVMVTLVYSVSSQALVFMVSEKTSSSGGWKLFCCDPVYWHGLGTLHCGFGSTAGHHHRLRKMQAVVLFALYH
jgi:hypothetical protein